MNIARVHLDALKTLGFCFQESCGGPAQRLISFAPTLYVPSHPLHRRAPWRISGVPGRQSIYKCNASAFEGLKYGPTLPTSIEENADVRR
jgi:hypothetical protein